MSVILALAGRIIGISGVFVRSMVRVFYLPFEVAEVGVASSQVIAATLTQVLGACDTRIGRANY